MSLVCMLQWAAPAWVELFENAEKNNHEAPSLSIRSDKALCTFPLRRTYLPSQYEMSYTHFYGDHT